MKIRLSNVEAMDLDHALRHLIEPPRVNPRFAGYANELESIERRIREVLERRGFVYLPKGEDRERAAWKMPPRPRPKFMEIALSRGETEALLLVSESIVTETGNEIYLGLVERIKNILKGE